MGIYYRIPICCINDPTMYEVDFEYEKMLDKQKPKAGTLSVKVRNNEYGEVPLSAENDMSILDFKNLYITTLKEK